MEQSRSYGRVRTAEQTYEDTIRTEDVPDRTTSRDGTRTGSSTRSGTTTVTSGEGTSTRTTQEVTVTTTDNQHHGIMVNLRLRFQTPHPITPTP